MIEYRTHRDDYILTIEYKGKTYRYKMICYHRDKNGSWWFLFTKTRVIDLIYKLKEKELLEALLPGQPPIPADFVALIGKEIGTVHGH